MKDALGHGSETRDGTIQKRPAGWTHEVGGRITHGPWPRRRDVIEGVAKSAHGSHAQGIAAVPSAAYAMHRDHNAKLNEIGKRYSDILNQFPRGPTGLTPDHIKATPEYRTAKAGSDQSFAALREHNGFMVKNFKSEMKADRDARRQARMTG